MSATAPVAIRGGQDVAEVVESVVMTGDLKALSPAQRVAYYRQTCESLGLNPLTKPFDYLTLNGKMVLYATRTCTDQLRSNKDVSISIVGREVIDGVYEVTARATLPNGRVDEEIGAVNVKGLGGEALANAHMKAQTKAKRRVTLSICGLGWLDESEVDSIAVARPEHVDEETGEIVSRRATGFSARVAAPPQLTPEQVGELRELLAEADLKMADLSPVIGTMLTKENASRVIAEWLMSPTEPGDEPMSISLLVRLALDTAGDAPNPPDSRPDDALERATFPEGAE